MMTRFHCAEQRGLACRLAKVDTENAYRTAVAIECPWYKIQALAWVVRFAADEHVHEYAREMLDARFSVQDEYERAAVLAWPIRALMERDAHDQARDLCCEAVARTERIEHPLRRAGALFLLYECSHPRADFALDIIPALYEACTIANSARAQCLLRRTCLMLPARCPSLAWALAELMPPGKYKCQALRRLEAKEYENSRPFFW